MHKQSQGDKWFSPWPRVKIVTHHLFSVCLCVCRFLSELGFEVFATFVPIHLETHTHRSFQRQEGGMAAGSCEQTQRKLSHDDFRKHWF